jgi:hypothetical protein
MVSIDDWAFKKSRRFTGSPDGVLTYHVEEVIVIYEDGLCNPDFSDVRFIDESDNFLVYSRKNYVDSSVAIFLVEISSVPVSPSEFTFYILAGNPDAIYEGVDISNGFFVERFEGSSLDGSKWDSDGKIIYRLVNNEMQIYDVLWEDVYDSSVGKQIRANFTLPNKFKVKYNIRHTETNNGRTCYTGVGITKSDNVHFATGFIRNQEGPTNKYYNSIWPDYTYDIHSNVNDSFEMEIRRLGSNKTLIYRNGTKIVERTDSYVNNKLVIHGMRNWTHPDFVGISELYLVSTTENPPNFEEESEWEYNQTFNDFRFLFGVNFPTDVRLRFCVRPLKDDFRLLASIRGFESLDFRTILNIQSRYKLSFLANFSLTYTILPLASSSDNRLVFYITGDMVKSLLIKGLISYDILGLPNENENMLGEEGEGIEENIDEEGSFIVIIGDTTYV